MTELKPCPFCGGEAAPTGDDCLGWLVSWFPTPEQAIAATFDARAERLRGEGES